jgi:hypothetical protein
MTIGSDLNFMATAARSNLSSTRTLLEESTVATFNEDGQR